MSTWVIQNFTEAGKEFTQLLRRSLRLMASGYYDSDGNCTVSYKEPPDRRRSYPHLGQADGTSPDLDPDDDWIDFSDVADVSERAGASVWSYAREDADSSVDCLPVMQMSDKTTATGLPSRNSGWLRLGQFFCTIISMVMMFSLLSYGGMWLTQQQTQRLDVKHEKSVMQIQVELLDKVMQEKALIQIQLDALLKVMQDNAVMQRQLDALHKITQENTAMRLQLDALQKVMQDNDVVQLQLNALQKVVQENTVMRMQLDALQKVMQDNDVVQLQLDALQKVMQENTAMRMQLEALQKVMQENTAMQLQLDALQKVVQENTAMGMQLDAFQKVMQHNDVMRMQLDTLQKVTDENTVMRMQLDPLQKATEEKLKVLEERVLELEMQLWPLADKMSNYALETQGASVIERLTSKAYNFMYPKIKYGPVEVAVIRNRPRTVIQAHSLPLTPGECWSFAGERGRLFISLSHNVTITHVTLGHITKQQHAHGSINSAPKIFTVLGVTSNDSNGDIANLGTFMYNRDGDSIQTFNVTRHQNRFFKYVELNIHSNWGEPAYTCVYNFRVHGKMPPAPSGERTTQREENNRTSGGSPPLI